MSEAVCVTALWSGSGLRFDSSRRVPGGPLPGSRDHSRSDVRPPSTHEDRAGNRRAGQALGIELGRVSVKARSNDGLGSEWGGPLPAAPRPACSYIRRPADRHRMTRHPSTVATEPPSPARSCVSAAVSGRVSRVEQRRDRGAFVHSAVAVGDLGQREHGVEDFAGVDLAVPDQIDELGQEAAYRGGSAVLGHEIGRRGARDVTSRGASSAVAPGQG